MALWKPGFRRFCICTVEIILIFLRCCAPGTVLDFTLTSVYLSLLSHDIMLRLMTGMLGISGTWAALTTT